MQHYHDRKFATRVTTVVPQHLRIRVVAILRARIWNNDWVRMTLDSLSHPREQF